MVNTSSDRRNNAAAIAQDPNGIVAKTLAAWNVPDGFPTDAAAKIQAIIKNSAQTDPMKLVSEVAVAAAKEEPNALVGGACAIEMQHKNPKLDKLMVELREALKGPKILKMARHKLCQHMVSSFNAIEKAQYDSITGPGSHERMFEFRQNWVAKRLKALESLALVGPLGSLGTA